MGKLKDNIGVIMVILGLIGYTGTFYSKFAKMESTIEQLSSAKAPDLTGIETNGFSISDNTNEIIKVDQNAKKEISILQKEIKLLELQIKELKAAANPLGG